MRVATFNILHGRTVGDGVHPDRLRACVQELDPDVLALQEVDLHQHRSGKIDLTQIAAQAMGAVAHRFVAAIAGTPGATWMAATGSEQPGTAAYGIALLSRYPVTDWRVARLPRIPVSLPMFLRGPNRITLVDEEPRTAVVARLETPLGPFSVATTHLSFIPGSNRRQLRRLVRVLRELPGPRLLIGDLNMPPAAVRRWSGMRALARADTFPSDDPQRQLDHILTDAPDLCPAEIAAPQAPLSDHRPLVVDLSNSS